MAILCGFILQFDVDADRTVVIFELFFFAKRRLLAILNDLIGFGLQVFARQFSQIRQHDMHWINFTSELFALNITGSFSRHRATTAIAREAERRSETRSSARRRRALLLLLRLERRLLAARDSRASRASPAPARAAPSPSVLVPSRLPRVPAGGVPTAAASVRERRAAGVLERGRRVRGLRARTVRGPEALVLELRRCGSRRARVQGAEYGGDDSRGRLPTRLRRCAAGSGSRRQVENARVAAGCSRRSRSKLERDDVRVLDFARTKREVDRVEFVESNRGRGSVPFEGFKLRMILWIRCAIPVGGYYRGSRNFVLCFFSFASTREKGDHGRFDSLYF